MSITWLPREMGIRLRCNGTSTDGCPTQEKRVTGLIIAKHVRSWFAKNEGWGRGLRKGRKRSDLCASCLAVEEQLFKKQGAEFEAQQQRQAEERKERREAKKAEREAEKQRQKQLRKELRATDRAARKAERKKASARAAAPASSLPTPSPSPSADSAPAPASP